MVGNIVNNEYDICTASLTITIPRQTVLDFMVPFGFETIAFYLKKPTAKAVFPVWDLFIQPFHQNLWLAIGIFSTSCTIVKSLF